MAKINKLLNDSKQNSKSISYTYGTVLSYDSDAYKAVVSLGEYNNAEKAFINKSGELLSVGDNVWIYYRGGGINSGYIAVRNGIPKASSISGGVGRFINQAHNSESFNDYDVDNIVNKTNLTFDEKYNTFRGDTSIIIDNKINDNCSNIYGNITQNYFNGYDNHINLCPKDTCPACGLFDLGLIGSSNLITSHYAIWSSIVGGYNRIWLLNNTNHETKLNGMDLCSVVGYENKIITRRASDTQIFGSMNYITECTNEINYPQLNAIYYGEYQYCTLCGSKNSLNFSGDRGYGREPGPPKLPYQVDKVSLFGFNNSVNYFYARSNFDINFHTATILGHNNRVTLAEGNLADVSIFGSDLFFDARETQRSEIDMETGTCHLVLVGSHFHLHNEARLIECTIFGHANEIDNGILKDCHISASQLEIHSDNVSNLLRESAIFGHSVDVNVTKSITDLTSFGRAIKIRDSIYRSIDNLSCIGNNISFVNDSDAKDMIGTIIGCGEFGKETYIDYYGNWTMCGTVTSAGSDYAEYWEWSDGNINDEDRRGLFVTMDGDKVKVANENDTILGIVSANPSVVGNGDSYVWKNKYLKDVFGTIIYEDVKEPIMIDKQIVEKEAYMDDKGDEHPAEYKTVQVESGEFRTVRKAIINPEYDDKQVYIPRRDRQEYCCVGHLGRLVMVDDGTCVENGYAKCSNGGIATKSEDSTRARVMKRIDSTHILVWWN